MRSPNHRGRKHTRRQGWLTRRRLPVRFEQLEPRCLLTAAALFDPAAGALFIQGTQQADAFTLAVAIDNSLVITHNSQILVPIDTSTQLPCDQGGTCPSAANTVQLLARLGEGNDRFELHSDGLAGLGATIDGQRGEADEVITIGSASDELVTLEGLPGQGQEPQPCFNVAVTDLNKQLDVLQLTTHNVRDIALKTLGGHDTVIVTLAQSVMGRFDQSYAIDLGGGNDVFQLTTRPDNNNPPPAANPQPRIWNLHVNGGGGKDSVTADVFYPTDPDIIVADIGIDLGAGNDALSFAFALAGANPQNLQPAAVDLVLRLDGGAGADSIDAVLSLESAGGSVDASVFGGPGNDSLSLVAEGVAAAQQLLVLDGGRGFDRCTATKNVTVLNCEADEAVKGDLNGDGQADAGDIAVLIREINDGDGELAGDASGGSFPGSALFDLNKDGLINHLDLQLLARLIPKGKK